MSPTPIRLGLLAASPVPYQIPLYRRLASDPRIDFTAIFASTEGVRAHDGGYAQPIVWDTDLLSGYRNVFLKRASRNRAGGGVAALRDPDVFGVVRHGKFDVLWVHGYASAMHSLAVLAQRLRGGALLFREEQTLIHPRPLWKALASHIALRVMFNGASALYIGTDNRRWFTHHGIPQDRLFFGPYAVDNDLLRSEARRLGAEREAVRASFGIRSAAPVILFVGRLIEKKQPLLLLEAFKQVRERHDCVLLVVGSGPLEGLMRERVAHEQIPDVIFAGFRNTSEIPAAYSAADIFALVSGEHETWGIVVNEAMNFGLPIVASDAVGCARDLVLDGVNGYVVDARSAQAVVQGLEALVVDPRRRARFGVASLRHIDGWSYERTAGGVMAAIEAIVGSERWSQAAPERSADDASVLSASNRAAGTR